VRRYKEGGPAAIANFEAGAEGFTTRAFRGCGVVTSDPFTISEDTEAVQMLQRFSQVGEFYVMDAVAGQAGKTGSADIIIFDEEADRHVKITYKDALIATGLVDYAPAVAGDAGNNIAARAESLTATNEVPEAIAGDKWMDHAIAIALGGNENAFKNHSAPIVIARPFIEHAMLSAVVTVSGADTGATIFGPSDMRARRANLKRPPNKVYQRPCLRALTSTERRLRLRRNRRKHVRQGHRGVSISAVEPTQTPPSV
jgi:hypothetical protein